VGAKLFHADRTDVTQLQVVYRNFAQGRKNGFFVVVALLFPTLSKDTALQDLRKL
jgi:hypothetical protein